MERKNLVANDLLLAFENFNPSIFDENILQCKTAIVNLNIPDGFISGGQNQPSKLSKVITALQKLDSSDLDFIANASKSYLIKYSRTQDEQIEKYFDKH